MEAGMEYDPRNFSDLYATSLGKKLWKTMTSNNNIIRMETATYLRRVAVEPLGPTLLQEFGDGVRADRVKQMLGHMARQILESRGYKVDRGNVRITRKGLFASGTRYAERGGG
jgi:hypothetical protein